jgi:hypothetical protein
MANEIMEIDELGSKIWKKNGLIHRDDGPAVITVNGTEQWYQKNKLHREGGEPAVTYPDGNQGWYQHGELHREDGPALIMQNGAMQEWYKNGIPHRLDGPAIINPKGKMEWWVDGMEYSEQEFNKFKLKNELTTDLVINEDSGKKKLKV